MASWPRIIKEFLSRDSISSALEIIPSEHAKIHDGKMFEFTHATADGAGLTDNATLDVLLSVNASTYPHLIIGMFLGGLGQGYFYESPTISSNGTEITPKNKNRSSVNVSGITVYHTPTVSDVGTELFSGRWLGTSSGPSGKINSGGEGFSQREWILKPSTLYLLRITARAADLQAHHNLVWYENQ